MASRAKSCTRKSTITSMAWRTEGTRRCGRWNDKAGYPAVLDPVIERLRVGGLLVTDNVLWGGDVARKDRSAETRAIRTYNERLAKDPRMLAAIVPLRDGVSIALKVRESR